MKTRKTKTPEAIPDQPIDLSLITVGQMVRRRDGTVVKFSGASDVVGLAAGYPYVVGGLCYQKDGCWGKFDPNHPWDIVAVEEKV